MPVINTNVAAHKARANFDRVQRDMDKAIMRLSSGKRINEAGDDASGLAIAGRMESQIRGLKMQIKNANDFQGLANTMEGALQEVSEILQRMRELAVQSSSGVANSNDKGYLDDELEELVSEINHINNNTRFNNTTVFAGKLAFTMFTAIDGSSGSIETTATNISAASLGVTAEQVPISVTAAAAIVQIDAAIVSIDSHRVTHAALSNRLDHTIDNLTNVVANTIAAKSRIEDADYAVETTNLTRATILQQAATSMIAQANAGKNYVLTLIQ